MTSILDVLFDLETNLTKTHHTIPVDTKKQTLQSPVPKNPIETIQHNQYLIHGLHPKYDFLLETKFSQHQTAVEIFLISKFGQILKTNSEISRIQLIQRCVNQQQFYRPCVNPITGFLYFKLDFFNLEKGSQENLKSRNIEFLLKGIDVEKLILSIEKMQGIQKISDQEECQGWYEEEQQAKLSLAKVIAESTQNPNMETIVSNKKKFIDNQSDQLRNLKTQYIQRFIETSNYKKTPVNLHQIRQLVKDIQRAYPHLSSFIKKKNRRSNYDPLYISTEDREKLNIRLEEMWFNNIQISNIQVVEQSYGSVNLKLEKFNTANFEKRVQFLRTLCKNHKYDQIQKYFESGQPYPIQISIDTKGDNLLKFLQKNGNVISLQTKMRILIQIYTFVNGLWQENQLILLIDNLENIHLTKRLAIKMRGLDSYVKFQKRMIWEDLGFLNQKRSQSILNLSSLFFKIFYRLNLLYARPKILTSTKTLLFEECKMNGIDKINTRKQLPKDVTSKTKQLLTSLNYIFSEQVYTASKVMRKQNPQIVSKIANKESDFMKECYLQTRADFSNNDNQGQEDKIQRLLSTRNVTCWLLKNI